MNEQRCTSSIVDRATGNITRCRLAPDHNDRHDDGAMTWESHDDPALEAVSLLHELLDAIDETDEKGEPLIGHDHTGTVNWLLDFGDKIRPLLKGT